MRLISAVRGAATRPLGATFATSLALQCLNAGSGIMLARRLDPTHRGELVAVLLWPTLLATIGSLGVDAAGIFHAARRTTDVGTLVGTLLGLCALQSVVLVGVGGTVIPLVLSRSGSGARASAFLYLSYIPIGMAAIYLTAVLNGLQRFATVNLLRLLVIGGSATGIAVLFAADRLTVRNATLVYLAANFVTMLSAGVALRRGRALSPRFSMTLARSLLGYGVRSHTSSVSSLLNERLDQLLISVFLAPARLGVYAIAVTTTSLTSLVGSSVGLIAFPRLAGVTAEDARLVATRRYLRMTLAGSLILTLPVIVLTPTLLRHVFGASYVAGANTARVLLVAAILLSMNRVLSAAAKAVNRPMDAGLAEFVALGVTLAGLGLLLPVLGIMGAAIASLLAYGVSTAWLLVRLGRAFRVPVVNLFVRGAEIEPSAGPAVRASWVRGQ